MEILQVDVTKIVSIWMGGLILLVPLIGLSARIGIKPILDSVARMREARNVAEPIEELELRFSRVEQQLQHLTHLMEGWSAGTPASHSRTGSSETRSNTLHV
jgi:hypothetical protein